MRTVGQPTACSPRGSVLGCCGIRGPFASRPPRHSLVSRTHHETVRPVRPASGPVRGLGGSGHWAEPRACGLTRLPFLPLSPLSLLCPPPCQGNSETPVGEGVGGRDIFRWVLLKRRVEEEVRPSVFSLLSHTHCHLLCWSET